MLGLINALLSSFWNSSFSTRRSCIFILHCTHRLLANSDVPPHYVDSSNFFSLSLCSERRSLSQNLTTTQSPIHQNAALWLGRDLGYGQDSEKANKNSRFSPYSLSHTDPYSRSSGQKEGFSWSSICLHLLYSSRIWASLESKLGDMERKKIRKLTAIWSFLLVLVNPPAVLYTFQVWGSLLYALCPGLLVLIIEREGRVCLQHLNGTESTVYLEWWAVMATSRVQQLSKWLWRQNRLHIILSMGYSLNPNSPTKWW